MLSTELRRLVFKGSRDRSVCGSLSWYKGEVEGSIVDSLYGLLGVYET